MLDANMRLGARNQAAHLSILAVTKLAIIPAFHKAWNIRPALQGVSPTSKAW